MKHLPRYRLGRAHAFCIPRFLNLKGPCEADFIRGYGIWGGMQRGDKDTGKEATWFLSAVLEVLPKVTNRVEIHPKAVDAWGIPIATITLRYSENERKMKMNAMKSLLEMSCAAGLDVRTFGATLPGQYVHELGGARLGSSPEASVLNKFNQCWDAKNLFVVDGSAFVTAGWQNPSLTMMAIADRACESIIGKMRLAEL